MLFLTAMKEKSLYQRWASLTRCCGCIPTNPSVFVWQVCHRAASPKEEQTESHHQHVQVDPSAPSDQPWRCSERLWLSWQREYRWERTSPCRWWFSMRSCRWSPHSSLCTSRVLFKSQSFSSALRVWGTEHIDPEHVNVEFLKESWLNS